MNACTWAGCGMCGRCTDGPRQVREERSNACDECGNSFYRGGVTYAGLGTFCGQTCKDNALAKRERFNQKRTA